MSTQGMTWALCIEVLDFIRLYIDEDVYEWKIKAASKNFYQCFIKRYYVRLYLEVLLEGIHRMFDHR